MRLVFCCSPSFVVDPGHITLSLYQTGDQAGVSVITAVHQRSPPAPVTAVQLSLRDLTEELQVPDRGGCVTVEGSEYLLYPRPLLLTSPERESNPEELFLTETVVLQSDHSIQTRARAPQSSPLLGSNLMSSQHIIVQLSTTDCGQ